MRLQTLVVPIAFGLGLVLPIKAADDLSMPQPVVQDRITYLTGGIGKEEADYMNALVKRYDLAVYFVEQKTGKFLADIDVVIEDRKGEILLASMVSGPIFLAKLPVGRYKITAIESGREKERYTRITGKSAVRLVFHWPSQPET